MTYCYINAFGDTICEDSGWYKWGRWVLVGVAVGLLVLTMIGFLVFRYGFYLDLDLPMLIGIQVAYLLVVE